MTSWGGIIRLMHAATNDPVNIGNPAEMSVEQIAREIISATGSRSRIVYQPLPVDDPKVRQPDITRARRAAGVGTAGHIARRVGGHDRVFPDEGRHGGPRATALRWRVSNEFRSPAGPVTGPFQTFSDLKTLSTGDGPALRQERGPAPPAASAESVKPLLGLVD